MMQFLRKIRQELVIENKVSKYLLFAIGEITLIMVGILLAVQVGEWNQAKNDRIEERVILTRLSRELNSNSENLSALLEGIVRKEQALEQVSLAFKGRPVEIDSIFLSDVIISSLWGWTVQPLQRLIYEEINSTVKSLKK